MFLTVEGGAQVGRRALLTQTGVIPLLSLE